MNDLHDTQIEAGVIATILHNPEFVLHSSDFLTASHFYHKDNGCIYWAVNELYNQGIDNIDAFNITTMINSNKGVKSTFESFKLPSMEEYIADCSIIARETLEEYIVLCKEVFALSYRRDLYNSVKKMQSIVKNTSIPTLEAKNAIEEKLNELSLKYITNGEIKKFGDKIHTIWNSVKDKRNKSSYGILSKFPLLNKCFTYEPTELYVVKGRMKQGKSAFLMNEAIYMLQNGLAVVYFDTEMSDELFLLRMLGNLTGIDIKSIKTGSYTDQDEALIESALEWIDSVPFVHINEPFFTNDMITTTVKILSKKINLGFVVYDYIKDSSVSGASELSNALGAKTDFLKNQIATKFEIPVLAAAQLNRGNEVADSDKIDRYLSVSIKWRNKTVEEIALDGKNCGNYLAQVNLNRIGDTHSEDEYIDFVFKGSCMQINQSKQQHSKEENPY